MENLNPDKEIVMVACIGPNNEIGYKNELLYDIKADMKRFVEVTGTDPIVMGRKTHESIGKVLPNRENFVVTRDYMYETNAIIRLNLDSILEGESERLCIIGGSQIYQESMPYATKLAITRVTNRVPLEADAYFPEINGDEWEVVEYSKHEENGVEFEFINFERIE